MLEGKRQILDYLTYMLNIKKQKRLNGQTKTNAENFNKRNKLSEEKIMKLEEK